MKLKLIAASIVGLGMSTAAWAVDPFTIQDIRIEGLQRTEPATIFSYLPVQVGDRFSDAQAQAIIKDLYATGFFDDVQVETMGNQVLLTVVERPVITDLRVGGGKAIKNDLIRTNLQNFGLATSQTYDEAIMSQAVEGLKREYANRGKYDAKITPKVARLDRNRVEIELTIDEGETTTIKNIEFDGNEKFSDRTLRHQISHTESGLFTWFRKSNRFSQDKMPADLESLSEFYQNRGYFDFKVTNAEVLPNPDEKSELNMKISVNEGQRYRFGQVSIAGDLLDVPAEEINDLNKIKAGKWYERSKVMELVRDVQST
ncbi:MAG TPA: outer membrane protein assembly factor BamA, partial [Vitreoscilla sp.]|nr:outer membrane protein assembly factor BamA [Vitreoscilla sp.]